MILTLLTEKKTMSEVTYSIDETSVPKERMKEILDIVSKENASDDELMEVMKFCNVYGELDCEEELDPYTNIPISIIDDYEVETEEWIDYMKNTEDKFKTFRKIAQVFKTVVIGGIKK